MLLTAAAFFTSLVSGAGLAEAQSGPEAPPGRPVVETVLPSLDIAREHGIARYEVRRYGFRSEITPVHEAEGPLGEIVIESRGDHFRLRVEDERDTLQDWHFNRVGPDQVLVRIHARDAQGQVQNRILHYDMEASEFSTFDEEGSPLSIPQGGSCSDTDAALAASPAEAQLSAVASALSDPNLRPYFPTELGWMERVRDGIIVPSSADCADCATSCAVCLICVGAGCGGAVGCAGCAAACTICAYSCPRCFRDTQQER
jgi:hypothetical protein